MKTETLMTCDCCEAKWEESFFCKVCSNQYIGEEFEEVPNLFWDGNPSTEFEWESVSQYSGEVCGNCCICHLEKPETNGVIWGIYETD